MNFEWVLKAILDRVAAQGDDVLLLVICDLSASPNMDLAGAQMLRKLNGALTEQGIRLAVAEARGRVRDLLRRDGFAGIVGGVSRGISGKKVLTDCGSRLIGYSAGGSGSRAMAKRASIREKLSQESGVDSCREAREAGPCPQRFDEQ